MHYLLWPLPAPDPALTFDYFMSGTTGLSCHAFVSTETDKWFLLNACLWSPPDPDSIYSGYLAINNMVTSSTNAVQEDTSDTFFTSW
eukprot:14784786-Ditylum_brightwellii.AAC.1